MYIDINDKTSLQEVRKAFSDFYPYLAINFYRKAHKKYETSPDVELIPPDKTIAEIKKTHVSGVLEIKPTDQVADVEKEFQTRFGLSVQIMRMENEEWVQTSGMDDFSISEVNLMSRNSSDEFIVSDEEEGFSDYA